MSFVSVYVILNCDRSVKAARQYFSLLMFVSRYFAE